MMLRARPAEKRARRPTEPPTAAANVAMLRFLEGSVGALEKDGWVRTLED
jgi:hypothetical protein